MRRLVSVVLVLVVVTACADDGDDQPLARRRAATTTSTTATTSTTTTSATTATTATTVAAGPPPPTGAAAPFVCPAPPVPRRPDPDRPRYEIRADVRPADGVVSGDLTVRFTPDLPVGRLVFRLWPNGPRPAAAGVHLDHGPVTVDGRPVQTRLTNPTTLEVPLPRLVDAGDTIEAAVPWRLTVPGSVQDRVSRDGDAMRLGSFFPLLAWEPGVGWAAEPPTSGFAESTTSPTADFRLSVKVPVGYGVLATGVLAGPGQWRVDAARDVALSVGRFRTASATVRAPAPVRVTVGVHQGVGETPESYLGKVTRVLEDFNLRYGPYPWPVYTLAITPGLAGGIEFPMHVMQGPGSVGRTTSHEVAHMWFYGLVGNNQGRDPWLDEALASWGEARFENTLGSFRSRSIPAVARGRAGQPMSFWEQHQSAYFRGVYVQGAVALGALGPPEQVDCALRHYAARNAHRIARDDDLVNVLTRFFPQARPVLARYGLP